MSPPRQSARRERQPGRPEGRSVSLTVEQAGERLREVGLRRTLVRVCLLQLLSEQQTVLTQGDISRRLEHYGFDESTIFRTLADLADLRVIGRVDLGDRTWRFWYLPPTQARQDTEAWEPAVHICRSCHGVIPLKSREFRFELAHESLDQRHVDSIILRGDCGPCRSERSAAATDGRNVSSSRKRSDGE